MAVPLFSFTLQKPLLCLNLKFDSGPNIYINTFEKYCILIPGLGVFL